MNPVHCSSIELISQLSICTSSQAQYLWQSLNEKFIAILITSLCLKNYIVHMCIAILQLRVKVVCATNIKASDHSSTKCIRVLAVFSSSWCFKHGISGAGLGSTMYMCMYLYHNTCVHEQSNNHISLIKQAQMLRKVTHCACQWVTLGLCFPRRQRLCQGDSA